MKFKVGDLVRHRSYDDVDWIITSITDYQYISFGAVKDHNNHFKGNENQSTTISNIKLIKSFKPREHHFPEWM